MEDFLLRVNVLIKGSSCIENGVDSFVKTIITAIFFFARKRQEE